MRGEPLASQHVASNSSQYELADSIKASNQPWKEHWLSLVGQWSFSTECLSKINYDYLMLGSNTCGFWIASQGIKFFSGPLIYV